MKRSKQSCGEQDQFGKRGTCGDHGNMPVSLLLAKGPGLLATKAFIHYIEPAKGTLYSYIVNGP
jgi:hypothetical protein